MPSFEALEEYAKQLNIKYHDRLELIKHSAVIQLFEKRIEELQQELAHFEQIKSSPYCRKLLVSIWKNSRQRLNYAVRSF
ncbi:FAA1 protein [Actinobacillus equuli]|nr:FAA1 protein [Actinobacillus equuli]